jgi:hypothetical protein
LHTGFDHDLLGLVFGNYVGEVVLVVPANEFGLNQEEGRFKGAK